MSGYRHRAIDHVLTVIILTGVATVFSYLVRLLYAKQLTVAEYGFFYSVFALMSFFAFFKDLGMSRSLIKFIPEFQVKKKTADIKTALFVAWSMQFVIWTLFSLFLVGISEFLTTHYFKVDGGATIINLIILGFWIDSFVYGLMIGFQGFQRMGYFASVNTVRMILVLIFSLWMFHAGYGIQSAVLAYLFTPIALLLMFLPLFFIKAFPEFFGVSLKDVPKMWRRLFTYGLPLMLSSIGVIILGYTDTIMITYVLGVESSGFYNVAIPTATIISLLVAKVSAVIIPLTSELHAKKLKKKISQGMELFYKYGLVAITPVALTLLGFPEIIIRLLFGNEYLPASIALRILGAGIIFASLTHITNALVEGLGRPGINVRALAVGSVLNITLNALFIPFWGIAGAATATSLSYLFMFFYTLSKVKDIVHIPFGVKEVFLNLFCGFCFVLTLIFLKGQMELNPYVELMVVGGISGLVYLALIWILKVVCLKEIKEISHSFLKKKFS